MKTAHADQIEEWVTFIKKNPTTWRVQHTRFLQSQLEMAKDTLNRIAKSPGGKVKIAAVRKITNKKLLDMICR